MPAQVQSYRSIAIAAAVIRANAWCSAGEILKRLHEAGLPRDIGMGMHDGYLIEAEIGAGERKDATSLGDTVNIAARLCARAEPGELIVSRVVGEPPQGSVLHCIGSGDLDLSVRSKKK